MVRSARSFAAYFFLLFSLIENELRADQPFLEMEASYPAPMMPLANSLADAPVASAPPSYDELVQRLTRTEARLALLEQGQPEVATPPIDPPQPTSDVLKLLEEDKKKDADKKPDEKDKKDAPAEKKWYEKYTFRGYAQFRWNSTLHEDEDGAFAQTPGDRSVGPDQNFLIRRARLIWAADVSKHLYVYLQPDFAITPPGSPDATNFAQIRDWYGDIYCDECKINRFRVGQSKVPYGFENMQSSSNRLPLDRNDALNSAGRNERDLGVFYYWTPEWAQELFTHINDEGLKGSGNYGIFGLGVYNGQGGSLLEQNENLHVVSRLTLPHCLSNGQIVEASIQAYTGMYTVLATPISPLGVGAPVNPTGTQQTGNQQGIRDERVGVSYIVYPQPWGFQTEWNVGRGPGLNDEQTRVEERSLWGGYAQLFYRNKTACHGEWWPFMRYNYYNGGYKPERNAPYALINEWEFGVEWQMNKQVELTTAFTTTDRTNTIAQNATNVLSYDQFQGQLLRFQLQINY